ncbi:hypothetical protein TRIP_C60214 [Candidatus Zixiibacteriota bacterium]|nr:hypothetical protein TRIP_C60214 [candidate division Zixibacteria bacterium]
MIPVSTIVPPKWHILRISSNLTSSLGDAKVIIYVTFFTIGLDLFRFFFDII